MSEAQKATDKRKSRSTRDSKKERSIRRNPNSNVSPRKYRVEKLMAERASYPDSERLLRVSDGRTRESFDPELMTQERDSYSIRGRPASMSNASDRRLSPLPSDNTLGKPSNHYAGKLSSGADSHHKRRDDIMMTPTYELDEKMTDDQTDQKYVVPKIEVNLKWTDKNLRYKKRSRRNSVSAESLDDEPNLYQDYKRLIFPKSDEALRSIQESCSTCFLFQGIDSARKKDMYDAMYSRPVKTGEVIYKQGDTACAFYIIETGKYQARSRVSRSEVEQVFEYHDRGVFGEYALMYNTGQNATMKCKEPGILWVLDRDIFMRGLFLGQRQRHARYADFVGKLTFFDELPDEVKERIPDCLQTRIHKKDEWIIQQGDREPRGFYIIEQGSVVVTQFVRGVEREIRRLKAMDYFGEIALLEHTRRTANVKVLSKRCIVVRMDNAWFYQLIGPLIKITFQTRSKSYRDATAADDVAPGMKANLALWDLISSDAEESEDE